MTAPRTGSSGEWRDYKPTWHDRVSSCIDTYFYVTGFPGYVVCQMIVIPTTFIVTYVAVGWLFRLIGLE